MAEEQDLIWVSFCPLFLYNQFYEINIQVMQKQVDLQVISLENLRQFDSPEWIFRRSGLLGASEKLYLC